MGNEIEEKKSERGRAKGKGERGRKVKGRSGEEARGERKKSEREERKEKRVSCGK